MTDSLGNGKLGEQPLIAVHENPEEIAVHENPEESTDDDITTDNIIEALPKRTDKFQIDMQVVETGLTTEYKVTISSGYNRYYASADLTPIQEKQAGMDLVISQIETAARQAFMKYMYEEVLPDE